MPRCYFHLNDNYPSLQALIKNPLDLTPSTKEDTISAIQKDISRTCFFSDTMRKTDFDKKALKVLPTYRNYVQGDLDGGNIAKILFIESTLCQSLLKKFNRKPKDKTVTTFNADDGLGLKPIPTNNHIQKLSTAKVFDEKKQALEERVKEIFSSDQHGFRIAFTDDKGLCHGLCLTFIPSQPDIFAIAVIQDIFAPPHQRQVHLFCYYKLLPSSLYDESKKPTTAKAKIIPVDCLLKKLFETINSERLANALANMISPKGEISIEAICQFKEKISSGQNALGLDEIVNENRARKKFDDIQNINLSLIAKCILNNDEQILLKNCLNDEKSKQRFMIEFNQISKDIDKNTKTILNHYHRQKANYHKHHKKRLKEIVTSKPKEVNTQQPFLYRHKKPMAFLSTGLVGLTTSLFFLFSLTITASSLISLSCVFLTLLASVALISTSLVFFTCYPNKSTYERSIEHEEKIKENKMNQLEKGTIESIKETLPKKLRIKILNILSSKSLNQPSKIIDDYMSIPNHLSL